MTWRVAKSLLKLRDQVNVQWPSRSKSDDGTIGDARHAATKSEHNPDANGVVRAMDLTNDPASGMVSRKLAEALVASRDRRILYLISNAQIISSQVSPWIWRPYNGVNAHRQHMHISVVSEPRLYDDESPWDFSQMLATNSAADESALMRGKGSWYSQYKGKYKWRDLGDKPNSNKLGVPDDCQGISFLDRSRLGKWFEIHAPNGRISIEQQTEIGPASWTGRAIDISAVCAERMGYSPKTFPTDAIWKWRPVATPSEIAGLTAQEQAIRFKTLRKG